MRILIVEDDPRIHAALADDLRRQYHAVDVVEDGLLGLDFARTRVHDVILLDILLPGLDGLELCRRFRSERSSASILMITSRGDVSDKVRALDAGADDYLVKPFDLEELSARIRAASRRRNGAYQPNLTHGRLQLDPGRRFITYCERAVPLTRSEYAILATLMQSPLQVFSRTMLRDKIAGFDDETPSDSVKTHIANLRRKLRAAGSDTEFIASIYGLGYRLADLKA
jgi:DNA-binding response OmpR family regulator